MAHLMSADGEAYVRRPDSGADRWHILEPFMPDEAMVRDPEIIES